MVISNAQRFVKFLLLTIITAQPYISRQFQYQQLKDSDSISENVTFMVRVMINRYRLLNILQARMGALLRNALEI